MRFAGEVCGIEFELDASGRATLGLFAAQFREERARIERTTVGALTSSASD